MAARIEDLNLRGIYVQKEPERVYPQRMLASHVVGYVNVDQQGQGGIEYSLDKLIRGKPGRTLVTKDARRRGVDRSEVAAQPGANVTLTIDENIQYIVEKELAAAINDTQALSGSIVVEDPNSGELLAVANWPNFDSNDPSAVTDDPRMNRAVAAAYEPGSTFKVITLASAFENGVANPSDMVDCQNGSIVVAGRLIHDWHPFGTLSVAQVLEHSSDVGSIKVALRDGAANLYQTARKFGIGELTGVDLPGENRGILRSLEHWTPSSIGSIAIGQEVSVTPVQMTRVISAVANGGLLYRPHVLKSVGNGPANGVERASDTEPAPRRVLDPKIAATMRELMAGVVLEGTGTPAALNGWTDAGKSGTAQKIDPATGRYSPDKYIASFVGFAPVNDPAITILVVLDSPVGAHHGGDVGGPVFRRVAEQVLQYLDTPHDIPVVPAAEMAARRREADKLNAQEGIEEVQAANEQNRQPEAVTAPLPATPSAPPPGPGIATVEFGGGPAITVPTPDRPERPQRERSLFQIGTDAGPGWHRFCPGSIAAGRHESESWIPRGCPLRSCRSLCAVGFTRGRGLRAMAKDQHEVGAAPAKSVQRTPGMKLREILDGVGTVAIAGSLDAEIRAVWSATAAAPSRARCSSRCMAPKPTAIASSLMPSSMAPRLLPPKIPARTMPRAM